MTIKNKQRIRIIAGINIAVDNENPTERKSVAEIIRYCDKDWLKDREVCLALVNGCCDNDNSINKASRLNYKQMNNKTLHEST